mgnify:CR=1 FL=1
MREYYWIRAFVWAWQEVKAHFSALVVSLATFVVADVFLFRFYGRMTASQMEAESVLSEILPGIIIFIILLLVAVFVLAPVAIDRERRKNIASLNQQIAHFQDRAASKIAFVFEENPPYTVLEKQVGDDLKIWLFRVGVKNIWNERLSDCSVKITVSPRGERYLSRPLKLASDNPPDLVGYVAHHKTFPINADDTELVDVVRVEQRKDTARIDICYAREGLRDISTDTGLIGGDSWVLTLIATAEIGKQTGESFVITANPKEVIFTTLTKHSRHVPPDGG